MKRLIKYFSILFILLITFSINVKAQDNTTYINLNNLSDIKEYSSLESFLKDYNDNNLPDVYITNFLFDGVSSVKSPDLDDFVESDSNDTKIKTLEIKVININNVGNYELSGSIKGAMIGVNTNKLKGDINIILNGVTLDTDSKKTPAIYVYNKDKNYTDCKVTIKTIKNTINTLEGGKLKKVSLIPSEDLSSYSKYYSNDSLTNYNKYTSYYGIYSKNEIDNILFATVQADSEDLKDGDPYVFYKASGAISSDIDLYFEGEGTLKVTSKNSEGIETKGNLIFTGGIGDYEIYAQDDCLNTTTATGNNVRNDISIDVNSLFAIVDSEADEGDAIDSNGTLTINGGTIIAVAHPTSADAGLDSVNGTYINGGTIVATGNMMDQIENSSKQKYIYTNLNSNINENTLIVIKDENNNIIAAYKTPRSIKNLLYSSSNINSNSYKIYINGTIDGEETNGLYTKINSYTNGEEISYSNVSNNIINTNNKNDFILKVLIIEIISLIVFLLIVFIDRLISKKRSNQLT